MMAVADDERMNQAKRNMSDGSEPVTVVSHPVGTWAPGKSWLSNELGRVEANASCLHVKTLSIVADGNGILFRPANDADGREYDNRMQTGLPHLECAVALQRFATIRVGSRAACRRRYGRCGVGLSRSGLAHAAEAVDVVADDADVAAVAGRFAMSLRRGALLGLRLP